MSFMTKVAAEIPVTPINPRARVQFGLTFIDLAPPDVRADLDRVWRDLHAGPVRSVDAAAYPALATWALSRISELAPVIEVRPCSPGSVGEYVACLNPVPSDTRVVSFGRDYPAQALEVTLEHPAFGLAWPVAEPALLTLLFRRFICHDGEAMPTELADLIATRGMAPAVG